MKVTFDRYAIKRTDWLLNLLADWLDITRNKQSSIIFVKVIIGHLPTQCHFYETVASIIFYRRKRK